MSNKRKKITAFFLTLLSAVSPVATASTPSKTVSFQTKKHHSLRNKDSRGFISKNRWPILGTSAFVICSACVALHSETSPFRGSYDEALLRRPEDIFPNFKSSIESGFRINSGSNFKTKSSTNSKKFFTSPNGSSYNSIRKLGEGGFGIVYLAEKDGKLYAVKEINLKKDNVKRHEEEVSRECTLLKEASSYTAVFYEQWFEENKAYIVLEYVNGKSLRQLIDENIDKNKKIIDQNKKSLSI